MRGVVPDREFVRQAQRHVVELRWLCDVARQVNTARGLDEVLEVVYWAIREGLGYDRAGINLFDYDAGIFEDRIGTDAQGQVVRPADRVIGLNHDSPIWRFPGIAALLEGAPYYYTADAAAECPPALRYLFDGLPAHNLMVALRSGERTIGMISVDNLLSGRPIVPDEVRPLLAVADQVGTAVERARVEDALQKERDFTNAVLQTAGSLVVVVDRQGRIVRFNRSCERVTGYRADEVQGCVFWELFRLPEERELAAQSFAQLTAADFPTSYEGYWLMRDGSRRLIAWSNTALLDPAGRPEYVIATGIDMTERRRADERLHRVYHALTGGVVVLDPAGCILEANAAAEEVLGLPLRTMQGQPLAQDAWTLTRPDGAALPVDERPATLAVRTGRPAHEPIVRVTYGDRPERWLQIDAVPLPADDGSVEQVVVSYVDLTARVQAEAALRESEERFRTLVETAPIGACITDEHGLFETVNSAYCALYGYTREELIGRPFTMLAPPRERAAFYETYKARLASGGQAQAEFELLGKGGVALTVLATSIVLLGRDGQPRLATFAIDITERKRAERHLAHAAHHDALTGLPNRTLLYERLDTALHGASPLALLLIDLDHFKAVNDTLGHDAGDLLLRDVAARLQEVLRPDDTVARLGGDEFAVLLPDTGPDGAVQVADKIRSSLAAPFVITGRCVEIGGSVGVALAPTHGAEGTALLRRADVAMYVAKRSRAGHAVYAPAYDERLNP